MTCASLVFALMLLAADNSGEAGDRNSASLEERLQAVNGEEAKHWQMWTDRSKQAAASLIEKPVYLWTNPTKNGVQYGSVFIWAYQGRPIVVGSIFAHPIMGRRRLVHEFHALTPTPLIAKCNDEQDTIWEPAAGIAIAPLPGADAPESTAGKRLIQMRKLGREFGGHTVDWRKQRWELRLLTQPIYRYELSKDDARLEVVDGALLALVTDAGTDPEVLLLLEARKGGWHYALLRFSDSSLYVTHREKEIWSAERGPEEQQNNNADHTYQVFQKPLIDEPVIAAEESTP